MMGDWAFFSNYGHVLVCLARNRQARLRDVALQVGITERAVQKIVRDLQDAGYLTVTKQGRCNRYRINKRKSLRHGLVSQCTVGKLLALVATPSTRPEPADQEEVPPSPEAVPRQAVAAAAASQAVEAAKPSTPRTDKKKKSKPPADTRQQGSLF
jgi:biotin operon repressor